MNHVMLLMRRKDRALSGALGNWLSRLMWLAGPLLGYTLVESLNHNNGWTDFSPLQIVLNLAWYYLVAGLVFLLAGRRQLSAGISAALFWAVGMANHYVIAFRGRTIFPADLLTLDTAVSVAGGYDYSFDDAQWLSLAALLLYEALLLLLPRRRGRRMPRPAVILPLCAAGVLYGAVFFGTDALDRWGIEPSLWTTRGNGFALNFAVCLRYSQVDEPEGYSQEALDSLALRIDGERDGQGGLAGSAVQGEETVPVNVIVIMGESFSDLTAAGEFETNEDAMPFLHSLTENTVKGSAYVSVFGGTTANSEWEFLTGNTTAFLPAGAVPYQLYVNDSAAALPQQMSRLGYRTVAMHPYYSSGWNRVAVYEDFGFDEVYFLSDFTDTDTMRGYVTDRSDYENLIRLYEEKEPGEKLFLFNVTMQNHSGYSVPWTGLERTVWLTGEYQGRWPTVDQYLSLMRQSDEAVEYLLDYFAQVDEPTLILIFGDHQPQVATSFYTELLGGSFDSLDASVQQRRQQTPFYLWANYDIGEAAGLRLSLNYRSTLLLEQAGLPLTGYQTFLSQGMETLPVVNAIGFIDAAGASTDDEALLTDEARAFLADYRIAQYCNLFDPDLRPEDFFALAGAER